LKKYTKIISNIGEFNMEILARAVGRRKEAVAQVQIIRGTGQFIINNKIAHEYLNNNSCSLLCVKGPFDIFTVRNPLSIRPLHPGEDLPRKGEGTIEIKKNSVDSENGVAPPPVSQERLFLSPKVENSDGEVNNLQELNFKNFDTIVKVKGGGLIGQAEAIKLGVARALCDIASLSNLPESSNTENSKICFEGSEIRKQLKIKGYLTQDSRVKERRKYGLKKARKAPQYHKR
jgi:small subunit ribosomal protein S9